MGSEEFWDNYFDSRSSIDQGSGDRDFEEELFVRSSRYFGPLAGKRLLDLGCGGGSASVFFASLGAEVISVDLSAVAIENLQRHIDRQHIANITPVCMTAMEIDRLGPVDCIYGCLILHHIEPFADFCRVMRNALARGGKGFFFENNAQSRLMVWFRQNLVGKLWIPKYGDASEFPLTPGEVDDLRGHFRVKVEFPELLLFRMVSLYLLRGRLFERFEGLDRLAYRYPRLRRLSHRQALYLS